MKHQKYDLSLIGINEQYTISEIIQLLRQHGFLTKTGKINPNTVYTHFLYKNPNIEIILGSIKHHTLFLQSNASLKERLCCILNGVRQYPTCKYCGQTVKKFKNRRIFDNIVYSPYCGYSCSRKDNDPFKTKTLEELKQIRKLSGLKHRGKKWSESSKENLRKVQNTKQTKEKRQLTNLIKYGARNVFASQSIKERITITNLQKYGTTHPMQSSEINQKQFDSACSFKEITTPKGNIIKVQGYQGLTYYKLLDLGYLQQDILNKRRDMPKIFYWYKGTLHRYFPDFYIPKYNLVIQTKSQYTLNKVRQLNEIKFSAAKQAGYNFKLFIH